MRALTERSSSTLVQRVITVLYVDDVIRKRRELCSRQRIDMTSSTVNMASNRKMAQRPSTRTSTAQLNVLPNTGIGVGKGFTNDVHNEKYVRKQHLPYSIND